MIKVKKIVKKFNEDTVIKYKDMTFEDGKSYMIFGPSGCGKSTLLNIISGVLSPDEGSVTIDKDEISKFTQIEKDKFRLKNIGYIFQDFKMMDNMTVKDNLEVLKLGNIEMNNMKELLKEVGLENKENQKIKTLSGGEKQRVAIVRALIKNPQIIVADEPTGNLNFSKGTEIMTLLNKIHKKNNKTMIIVSHDERLMQYVDQVINYNDLIIE